MSYSTTMGYGYQMSELKQACVLLQLVGIGYIASSLTLLTLAVSFSTRPLSGRD